MPTVALKLTSHRMISIPITTGGRIACENLRTVDATRVRLSLTHHDLAIFNLSPSDDVRFRHTADGAIVSIALDTAEVLADTADAALFDGDVPADDAPRARHILSVMRTEIGHAQRCRAFLADSYRRLDARPVVGAFVSAASDIGAVIADAEGR